MPLLPGSDNDNLFSTTPYATRGIMAGTPSHTCTPDVSNVFDSGELEKELANLRQAVNEMKSEHPEMCGESAPSLPLPFPEYEAAFTAYRRTHGWDALGFEVDEAMRDANEVISTNNCHAEMKHSTYQQKVVSLAELEASAEILRGLKPGDQVPIDAMTLIEEHGKRDPNFPADLEVGTTGYGLRMAVAGDSRDLLHSLSGFLGMHMPSYENMVYCPGVSPDEAQDSMQGADSVGSGGDGGDGGDGGGAVGGYDDADSTTLDLFHRNAEGKICFTPAEASRASKHIAELNLDEVRLKDAVRVVKRRRQVGCPASYSIRFNTIRDSNEFAPSPPSSPTAQRVKACLQYKRFVLPQQTTEVEALFCNEAVYGSLNVLSVAGLVKMEPICVGEAQDAAGDAAGKGGDQEERKDGGRGNGRAAPFSAWPTTAASQKSLSVAQEVDGYREE